MKPWTRLDAFVCLVPWLIVTAALPLFAGAYLASVKANYPVETFQFCAMGFGVGLFVGTMAFVGVAGTLGVLARARLARKTGKGAGDDEVQG